jgi:hypothetical protein
VKFPMETSQTHANVLSETSVYILTVTNMATVGEFDVISGKFERMGKSESTLQKIMHNKL